MIEISLTFLLSALIFSAVILYIAIRNHLVCSFRMEIISICKYWSLEQIDKRFLQWEETAFVWYYSALPSYSKMLFSFKPLKMKYWMTKEKNEKLLNP